jgi:hypothetical protein
MSRIYRISPQQADIERRKALMPAALFMAVIIGGVLLFTPDMKGLDNRTLLPILLFAGGVFALSMFRQIRTANRRVRKTVETFELEVDDAGITRRYVDAPTLSIGFNEITAIQQRTGQGTMIKTAQPTRFIWVPSTLQGYAEVMETLRQRSGVVLTVKNYNLVRTYSLGILFLIGWIVLMNAHERRLILTLSATLALGLLWCLVVIWRNPNVSRKLKRSTLLILLPLFGLIARFYQAW